MAFDGFTPEERAWNAPVGFFLRADDTIDIGGMHMGDTKKFRNVREGSRVAFVVDIVDTSEGWYPIYLEIRGTAEARSDVEPPGDGFSREVIHIHPDWTKSFNLPPVG
jgi:pyridoxamine 5'-phosphate oxidase family protein